jgi:AraC-like DNA-binding protein
MSPLAAAIDRNLTEEGVIATSVPRVTLIRVSEPTVAVPVLYRPALCIVAQGRKRVILGEAIYHYGAGESLVVSVDLPVMGQVTEASPAEPYLCLQLDLDPAMIGELMLEAGQGAPAERAGMGLCVSALPSALVDAATRLVQLIETPEDIPFLAPLIEREILYRFLQTEQSARLRQIATADTRLASVNRAINWLKAHFTEPFTIESVAQAAYLSPSALHHAFKAVTAMSPLQYQKQLRLQEARRLMLSQGMDAASAGFQVGYESPSQFSREYARQFGAPPLRDIARLRNGAAILA